MEKIPEWQYPLYKNSDKTAYNVLKNLGKSGKYPEIAGSGTEISDFLKMLIVSQGNKDYRAFRDVVVGEFRKKKLAVKKILRANRSSRMNNDESWAVFTQDRRICEMINGISGRKIEFVGAGKEIAEFSARFLLSQMLQDWRGPLIAVLIKCRKKKVSVSKLNNLLKIWDYTGIFKN